MYYTQQEKTLDRQKHGYANRPTYFLTVSPQNLTFICLKKSNCFYFVKIVGMQYES